MKLTSLEAKHCDGIRDVASTIDQSMGPALRLMLGSIGNNPQIIWERIGALQFILERGTSVPLQAVISANQHCSYLLTHPTFSVRWTDREGINLSIQYSKEFHYPCLQ